METVMLKLFNFTA